MQCTGSSLLMDVSLSSCCPLGWGHRGGRDIHDSLKAKSKPEHTRSANHCYGAPGTFQLPRCPPPQPRVVLPLPLLTLDVSMEFLASLTFLTPHPQSLPTSYTGFCPELQRAQLPLEPKIPASTPAQAPGLGMWKRVLSPHSKPQV